MKSIGIGIAAAILLVGAGGKPGRATKTKPYASDSAAVHARDVLKWRSERLANLRKPDGWLSLAGLFWLDEGENKFGSAVSNKVRFPEKKAPEKMGSFFLENGKVRVRVNGGVPVTSGGKPVTEMELKTDEGGEDPTTLAMGPLTWYVIKRADRFAVRIKDRESPGLRRFQGIRYYPIAESWRITARFEPYVPPQLIKVPNITGQVYDETTPGALVFERDGKTYRLDPILEKGSDELFVIFADATSGRDTYGGGRFLYTAMPGPDNKVVLDFNRAYNPPCAFTPWATCPLPPSQNKLPIPVEAGERAYGDKGVVGPGHTVN